MSKRFKFAPAAIVAALAIPLLTQGCSSDASNPLCCNEFKVGASITADIGGTAQSQIAVQAVSDVAAIASAAIDDITTACRGIASELDAPKDKQDAAEAEPNKQKKLELWCSAAVSAVATVKAQAKVTFAVKVEPVKCEVSAKAKLNCQAKCSGSASCDFKANPPECKGGTLSVACKGGCTAKAGVALQCTGKCEGTCKGSCDASGGVAVQCSGKCEGKCSADAQGNGNGLNAQGECTGYCDAKCTANATAPAVTCTGSCSGECSAKCTGSANASVQCNGTCDAEFEPLKCEGGKLEGGCKAEAKCEGNCDASVSAKAECTPPRVTYGFTAAAGADLNAAAKLKGAIEANFGLIYAFQARLDGVLKATGSFAANIGAVTDIKAACIPPLIAAVGSAGSDLQASFKATGSLVGSL
jgi:hypothetical protein